MCISQLYVGYKPPLNRMHFDLDLKIPIPSQQGGWNHEEIWDHGVLGLQAFHHQICSAHQTPMKSFLWNLWWLVTTLVVEFAAEISWGRPLYLALDLIGNTEAVSLLPQAGMGWMGWMGWCQSFSVKNADLGFGQQKCGSQLI